MSYEVEMKFPVAELETVAGQLEELEAEIGEEHVEIDQYYAHPCRDFAATDEALRIRRIDCENRITYKGPKVDQTTKTRQEIELPLPSGEATSGQWGKLLLALGFKPVAEVRKHRRKARLKWPARPIEATLDRVDGVGTFVELETTADEDELDVARNAIQAVAEHLGLGRTERRSYLELLLEATGGGSS